jgi:hypothetical protein
MEKSDIELLNKEQRGSFDFFWHEANIDANSPGYGLIRDSDASAAINMASVASVGFGLAALVVAVEKEWITREEGLARSLGTVKTFRDNVEQVHGFFFHFVDMQSAKNEGKYGDGPSIIDTALFLSGAFVNAEYFGGEIQQIVEDIYQRIEWPEYYDAQKNQFYMGYNPTKGGFGHWDMYAEQLIMYFLGIGSPTHPIPARIYEGFSRRTVQYGRYRFYTSPGNALFVHQYSLAFLDLANAKDKDGVDWFDNSRKATLAQHQYALDNPKQFKTLSGNSWGLTACQGPTGYRAYGAPPFEEGTVDQGDGTVAPSAALGAIVFTPTESLSAFRNFMTFPGLWGRYGLKDSYNLDMTPPFYADRVIGIDKGITLVMIENFQTQLIWKLFMKNEHIQNAWRALRFSREENSSEYE